MPMVVYTEDEVITKCEKAEEEGARRCAEDRDRATKEARELRNCFRHADAEDWQHLDRLLGDSGHGKFWRAVLLGEVKPTLERQRRDLE